MIMSGFFKRELDDIFIFDCTASFSDNKASEHAQREGA